MGASPNRSARRAELTAALTDIVMAEGLDALSLRPAAARLGTSDRMLLYYFNSKAELMSDVLGSVTERFIAWLADSSKGVRIPPHQMIGHAVGLMGSAEAKPYLNIWFEIVARAARGDAVFATTAEAIAEAWNDWIVRTVHFPQGVASRAAAAMMLAIVNGIALLEASAPNVAAAARSRVQTAAT